MAEVLLNWFKPVDRYLIKGRVGYSGPAPFGFDKENLDDMASIFQVPWLISWPDARDRLWRVVGLESFCIRHIAEGTPIGIVVVPVQAEERMK